MFDSQEFKEMIEKCADKTCQKSEDANLLKPLVYIQQVPGKHYRSKLALALNYWLNIPLDKLVAVGEIVNILHNSSLLLDDIQDNSVLRRGIPVAHSIYGVPATIHAANYTMSLALEMIEQLGHPDATRIAIEQALEGHRGQGMDIYWRENFICPSEEEYNQMVIRKTGGLFMFAISMLQLFSEVKDDYSRLAAILGLYVQIRDDYMNLCSKEYSDQKSYCEDITEGKFSYPVIHAIQQEKDNKEVLHILRQRTKDVGLKKHCVSLLEKQGSFEYTRKTLEALDKEVHAEVARLGANPIMESLLSELSTWKDLNNEFEDN